MNNGKPSMADGDAFEALLEYLKNIRGFDFTGYKRSSLRRRIDGRMHRVNVGGYTDYIDYLEVHPDEFAFLFNTILINVTQFFRDPQAWQFISEEVVPEILKAKKNGEAIRCWCAGVASGEEAYTLAMVLAEKIGVEEFQRRVKIYATDVDEEALTHARTAGYGLKEIQVLPPDLRQKYFEVFDARYVFRGDMRRLVIFGRHDLTQDAPISKLDLLVVRNTLMYFNAETQAKILARLHFAVNATGFLFLGKAEMLISRTNLFKPFNLRFRIFSKIPGTHIIDQYLNVGRPVNGAAAPETEERPLTFCESSFETFPAACLVIDLQGMLVLANQRARAIFRLRPEDIGRLFSELEAAYKPIELRSVIDRVIATNGPIRLSMVEWRNPDSGEHVVLDIAATPILVNEGKRTGINIGFFDMTEYYKLQEEIRVTKNELETTNEELHSSNEELETTNEELQSTVEELQTTNEELQSTNEEMETMNEELQATNEELQTANEELRHRTDELDHANAFKESIFVCIRAALIVVDRNFIVRTWTAKAEDLWGLRPDEAVGKTFFNLDIGLPVGELQTVARHLLSGERDSEEKIVRSTNRKGKPFDCRVTCTPWVGPRGGDQVQGVVLVMEEWSEPSDKGKEREA